MDDFNKDDDESGSEYNEEIKGDSRYRNDRKIWGDENEIDGIGKGKFNVKKVFNKN